MSFCKLHIQNQNLALCHGTLGLQLHRGTHTTYIAALEDNKISLLFLSFYGGSVAKHLGRSTWNLEIVGSFPFWPLSWSCFSNDPSSTPRSCLLLDNWSVSCQLGFLTMLCSLALFVSSFGFIGPEKPHWGSGQLSLVFFGQACSNLFNFYLVIMRQ